MPAIVAGAGIDMQHWNQPHSQHRRLTEAEAGLLAAELLDRARVSFRAQAAALPATQAGRPLVPALLRRHPELCLLAALVAWNLGAALVRFV